MPGQNTSANVGSSEQPFALIETLRREPASGFVRLERHLARLFHSAEALGFGYDPRGVRDLLASVTGDAPLRVRLTLGRDADVSISSQLFEPLCESVVWKLRRAATILSSADPLLRHKTTRRALHQKARAEFGADEADEVILSNERGEICEGTITNIFADFGDGLLLTPHSTSGLLPGILRGELLEQGKAKEAVLSPDDLFDAKALWVGNSLRGMIQARMSLP